MIRSAKTVVDAALEGENLTGKFAKTFKWLKVVGETVSVLGAALEGVAILVEAIEGGHQREELRK
jgi:hypothetical protein